MPLAMGVADVVVRMVWVWENEGVEIVIRSVIQKALKKGYKNGGITNSGTP